ncbi:helix-turn-helix domain-containing protein [Virgibacillus profundi]|nr:helix-turn-helix transcriptional regulator [Virgibacillus profundi]
MNVLSKQQPLRDLRKSKGFTQYEMAQSIGVSLSMYEKVERGYVKATRNFIDKTKSKYPYINVNYIFFNN